MTAPRRLPLHQGRGVPSADHEPGAGARSGRVSRSPSPAGAREGAPSVNGPAGATAVPRDTPASPGVALPEVLIRVPPWVATFVASLPAAIPRREDRLRVAIELARRNVAQRSGGPFGAAVFDDAGRLVAPGVNLVVPLGCSILHAEMVALALAQRCAGRFDLSDGGRRRYELCASTEPCAMCFGAIPWSGVSCVVCGARDEDARAAGFDEGPKLADWVGALAARGIEVVRDVLRSEAAAVLSDYRATGGPIYNGSTGAAGAGATAPGVSTRCRARVPARKVL
jgi:tRNA(Arg) A34 adenosine deaminase TadA